MRERLFEIKATTDKFRGKHRKAVRSRALQTGIGKITKSYLNLRKLRTRIEGTNEKQSEAGATSTSLEEYN